MVCKSRPIIGGGKFSIVQILEDSTEKRSKTCLLEWTIGCLPIDVEKVIGTIEKSFGKKGIKWSYEDGCVRIVYPVPMESVKKGSRILRKIIVSMRLEQNFEFGSQVHDYLARKFPRVKFKKCSPTFELDAGLRRVLVESLIQYANCQDRSDIDEVMAGLQDLMPEIAVIPETSSDIPCLPTSESCMVPVLRPCLSSEGPLFLPTSP